MEKRFVFRGNAVGAAGHIDRPDDLIIWVQGASSLPVIGGYSRSSADPIRFLLPTGEFVFSVENARTQATGDFSPTQKAFTTLANSVVKGMNVSRRLTADAVEATLTSTHPDNGGEPSIVHLGTSIFNMRLDGYPIIVTIDDVFNKFDSYSELSRAYSSDDAFYKRYGNRFQKPDNYKPPSGKRPIPETGGYVVTTIVSNIETKHPKAVVNGHVITLEGFGRIFLGELLITAVSRRLTLVRLKLGSPVKGDIVCAEVESNGNVIF